MKSLKIETPFPNIFTMKNAQDYQKIHNLWLYEEISVLQMILEGELGKIFNMSTASG